MARAADRAGDVTRRRPVLLLVLGAIGGALLVVGIHPIVGLPLSAACLAAASLQGHGIVAWISALLGAIAATWAAGMSMYVIFMPLAGVPVAKHVPYVHAAWLFFALAASGIILPRWLTRRSALSATAVLALALSGAQFAALTSLAADAGMSAGAYVTSAAREVFSVAAAPAGFTDAFAEGWPATLVSMNGLASFLTVAAVSSVGARLDPHIHKIPPLAELDLDARVALLAIAPLALMAAGRFTSTEALVTVATNVLVVARIVFLLQGVAVFAGLYRKANLPKPLRVAGFVLLGVVEAFVPAVSIIGLADIWLNLRKLPRGGPLPSEGEGRSGEK